MKNKIYPFLLGLSCIVIVALVSFKNSEKAVEKEQMVIVVGGLTAMNKYPIVVHTADKTEKQIVELGKEDFNLKALLSKIQQYSKEGWEVTNSNSGGGSYMYTYTLEREKK